MWPYRHAPSFPIQLEQESGIAAETRGAGLDTARTIEGESALGHLGRRRKTHSRGPRRSLSPDRLHRTSLKPLAVILLGFEHDHLVGDVVEEPLVVYRDDEVLTCEAGEEVAQRRLGGGVEAGRRLVEEQHVGAAQQGARDAPPCGSGPSCSTRASGRT